LEKVGRPRIEDSTHDPPESLYGRAFALRYSPRPHIKLFAHQHTVLLTEADAQDNRVVPEPGTVDKAHFWLTLPILAKQDCIMLQSCPFRSLRRENLVLCRMPINRSRQSTLLLFSLVGLLFQLPPRTPRAVELYRPGDPCFRLANNCSNVHQSRSRFFSAQRALFRRRGPRRLRRGWQHAQCVGWQARSRAFSLFGLNPTN